jgi:hypothetical protein
MCSTNCYSILYAQGKFCEIVCFINCESSIHYIFWLYYSRMAHFLLLLTDVMPRGSDNVISRVFILAQAIWLPHAFIPLGANQCAERIMPRCDKCNKELCIRAAHGSKFKSLSYYRGNIHV